MRSYFMIFYIGLQVNTACLLFTRKTRREYGIRVRVKCRKFQRPRTVCKICRSRLEPYLYLVVTVGLWS